MELLVPVVTVLGGDGRVDEVTTHRYAAGFRYWWPAATALVCGGTGLGDILSPAARDRVAAIWGQHLPAGRLVRCTWAVDEARRLADRGVRILLAGAAVDGPGSLADAVRSLRDEVYLYSHPRFGWVVTPRLVGELRDRGALPHGLKLSKASPAAVRACRAAGGDRLVLWDGTARHVRASLAAGADGVAAACLATLPPVPYPTGPAELQRLVDASLVPLDALPDRRARTGWLTERVRERFGGGT